MLSEIVHFFLSLIIGIIFGYIFDDLRNSIIIALLGGFFVDVDHFIDYFITKKHKFNFYEFRTGIHFKKSKKAYLFFHSYELIIIAVMLSLFTDQMLLLVFAVSLLAHLIFDTIHNRTKLTAYIYLNRAHNKFMLKVLGCKDE